MLQGLACCLCSGASAFSHLVQGFAGRDGAGWLLPEHFPLDKSKEKLINLHCFLEFEHNVI